MLPLIILTTPRLAAAEGFLANGATLRSDTVLYLDINATAEQIYWFGEGNVTVYDPKGTEIGTLAPNYTLSPTAGPGTYRIELQQDQTDWWWVSALGLYGDEYGRLFSYDWHFSTTGTDAGQWAYFFVTVPLGDRSTVGVVLAETSGLIGDDLHIIANTTGISGHAPRSVEMAAATPIAELPLYLDDPGRSYASHSPTLGDIRFDSDADLCDDVVAPEVLKGTFEQAFDYDGTWQITCDTSGDGEYDLSGHTDLVIHHGAATMGTLTATWDGLDADGEPVPPGELQCRSDYFQGAVHLLVGDAHTAFEGVRLFARDGKYDFPPTDMFWDDVRIQDNGSDLPWDYGTAAVSSGPRGTSSDDAWDTAEPNTNAHSWGNYSGVSKGADAWVDTWMYTQAAKGEPFTLVIVDPDEETDGDALLDVDETCRLGTDPDEIDTDDDGLTDGQEVLDVSSPQDTDGNGTIDALDPDDDGDGLVTRTEVEDGARFTNDADGDGVYNWHETDADDDGIPDGDEPNDDDGDGTPDYLQAAGTPSGPSSPVGPSGSFQGGVGACSSAAAPAALGWLAALMLAARRRRYC